MDAHGSLPDGFIWQGSLEETDIRSLYAACHSLRFSGRLQLKDGPQQAEVLFVAGEPIEIDGGDTQRIALWSRGTFRAVQAIPSLQGELTGSREIAGSLAETKPSSLWAWISEYRLTCEIELERPGGKAVVTFQNGHAEQASVNGLPELAALARVSSWTDGMFKVRLRPLFVDGVIPVAPPMPESSPPSGPRQFDVSRSIPMDLRNKLSAQQQPPPLPARPPTPPLGELAQRDVEIGRPPNESTARTFPLPPPVIAPPTDAIAPIKKKSSAGLIVVLLLAIVLAGGAGAAYYFHLPPFSPPPRPVIDAPPPKPDENAAANSGTTKEDEKNTAANSGGTKEDEKNAAANSDTKKEDEKSAAANSGTTKEDEKNAAANPGTTKEDEKNAAANSDTKKEDEKSTAKADEKTTEAKAEDKVDEKKDRVNREKAEKLIAKARMLLVEGHEHTALDLVRKAQKLQPKNATYRVYEQQALGKLGRAELLIEGKGAVTVDGHRFAAPRKVKVAAGPHTIDSADGESEVTLKRGERKKLRGKKG